MLDEYHWNHPFKILPKIRHTPKSVFMEPDFMPSVVKNFNNPLPVGNIETNVPNSSGTQHFNRIVHSAGSCVAFKFNNGVMIGADTLVTYGNMARFTSIDRVFKLSDQIVLGCSGEFADFQFLERNYASWFMLKKSRNETALPEQFYKHIAGFLYKQRCEMRRLSLNVVIGGISGACEAFLARIDSRGANYIVEACCTGMGQHLAMPLIKERLMQKRKPPINKREGLKLIGNCMMVLYYRDCLAYRNYKVALCTPKEAKIIGPFKAHEDWSIAKEVVGF